MFQLVMLWNENISEDISMGIRTLMLGIGMAVYGAHYLVDGKGANFPPEILLGMTKCHSQGYQEEYHDVLKVF